MIYIGDCKVILTVKEPNRVLREYTALEPPLLRICYSRGLEEAYKNLTVFIISSICAIFSSLNCPGQEY